MNICHVITRLMLGGAQENTVLTCEGLHHRGHHVTLIIGPETGPEGDLHSQARSGGYDFLVLPSLRRAVHPIRDALALRDLRRLFRSIKPEIVHTHSSKAGILARIAARKERVPHIVHTIHGMSFNRTQPAPVRMLYRSLERYCAGFTDHLITVADAMTRQCLEAGIAPPERFTTVYSGMRMDWFDPARYDRQAVRKSWGVGEDDVVVAAVARLFRNKGYEQLIPAMEMAVRSNPRLRFVWIGDGAHRAEYEQRLVGLGIRDRVHLTGLIPADKVPEALAGIDMLVHASLWEGLPRAAAQALLMEKPVISFDIDGAPEVVLPGRTGILVPYLDVPGLAKAMLDLAGDADQRRQYGTAGRALCLQQFDWQVMVERIEQVYLQLRVRI